MTLLTFKGPFSCVPLQVRRECSLALRRVCADATLESGDGRVFGSVYLAAMRAELTICGGSEAADFAHERLFPSVRAHVID